jgi:hypothetical protein
MSTFKKDYVIEHGSVFTIVERESFEKFNKNSRKNTKMVNLTDSEMLIIEGSNMKYKISSVVSYALKNNQCPIDAYERAIMLGHKTHWINAIPTVLSSTTQPKRKYIKVNFDMIYNFEGKYFRIAEDFNNNLKLVPADLN